MSKNKKEGTKNYTRKIMPDFSGYSAYVLGGAFYGDVVELMAEAGFEKAPSVNEADLVVFIGGADIDPALYNQKKHPTTSFSPGRDTIEKTVFERCVELQTPMFGICRGAQLLQAMNGGELWQDVNNHAGLPHTIVDIEDDVRVVSSSLHHQMLKNNANLCIIAVTENDVATQFADDTQTFRTDVKGVDKPLEIEAGCYLETGSFFVQGHPEIGSPEYRSWCMWKLHSFLQDWELHVNDYNEELDKAEQVLTQIS